MILTFQSRSKLFTCYCVTIEFFSLSISDLESGQQITELSVFGASMAGACIGFLFQNHRQASIFMGGTGALALGGALTAMASCTGMFFPLFIASGVFVLEAFSAALQVHIFPKTMDHFFTCHSSVFTD